MATASVGLCLPPLALPHQAGLRTGCCYQTWQPLPAEHQHTYLVLLGVSAQSSTPGVFRCACPAPGPLGCGGSTPKPLAHSYTKPCVSPFGPSARRVPDKNCDTQGWLCGEGGTRARQRLSSWQGPGSWCSPGQNFLAPYTHTGSMFLTVGAHWQHEGCARWCLSLC